MLGYILVLELEVSALLAETNVEMLWPVDLGDNKPLFGFRNYRSDGARSQPMSASSAKTEITLNLIPE